MKAYQGCIYNPLDDCIYVSPRNAASVARFNTATEMWETFGTEFPVTENLSDDKWGSLAVSSYDNCYYALPHSLVEVNRMLKIDPTHSTSEQVGRDLRPLAGEANTKAWVDAVAGADGCIYGLPLQANCVLRFDPSTNKFTTFGNVEDTNLNKMHASGVLPTDMRVEKYGTGVLGPSGRYIFAFPAMASRVLCVDTQELTVEQIGDDIGTGDGNFWLERYQFWGAYIGGDNCIYGIELSLRKINMSRVLRIDPMTKTVSVFRLRPQEDYNIFLGGFVGMDGCIYSTGGGNYVLQIDPFGGTVRNMVQRIPSEMVGMKFLGYGARDRDGNIWFAPSNVPARIIRVAPRRPQTPFLTTLVQPQHHVVLKEGLRDLRCYGPALAVALWREAVRVGGDCALVSELLEAAAATLPTVIMASIEKENGRTASLLLRTILRVLPPQVLDWVSVLQGDAVCDFCVCWCPRDGANWSVPIPAISNKHIVIHGAVTVAARCYCFCRRCPPICS